MVFRDDVTKYASVTAMLDPLIDAAEILPLGDSLQRDDWQDLLAAEPPFGEAIDTAQIRNVGFWRHSEEETVPALAELERISGQSFEARGRMFYPANGFISWHTNYQRPGRRLYLVKATGDSFFRYWNGEEVITLQDALGWSAYWFDLSATQPLWHCVGAKDVRMSFGFRLRGENV